MQVVLWNILYTKLGWQQRLNINILFEVVSCVNTIEGTRIDTCMMKVMKLCQYFVAFIKNWEQINIANPQKL